MNKKHTDGWKKHWDFILLDLCALQLSYILAYWLVHGIHNPYAVQIFRYLAAVFLISQLAVIVFSGNYSGILRRHRYQELAAVGQFAAVMLGLVTIFLFAAKVSSAVSRLQTGLTVAVYFAADWALRVVLKRYVRNKIIRERGQKSLVVVTSARLAEDVLKKLFRHNSYCDFHVTRVVLLDAELPAEFPTELEAGDAEIGEPVYSAPVTRLTEEAIRELGHDWVDEVFVFQPNDMLFPMHLLDDLMTMGITVNFSAEAIDSWPNTDLRKLGDFKVLTVGHRFASAGALAVKRLADILGGVIGCILTGIIFLFVAPAIYRADPGPVFFTQERIGQNGKRFKLYKIRSMYMDADERKKEFLAQNRVSDGMMFKLDFDPRIIGNEVLPDGTKKTGIGEFIRKYSLDEFPQFWNVLKGDMSIVGTRPPTVDEWEKYKYHHRARLAFRPGVTGMWQVSGRSNITDFEEVVRLDTEYIEHWSIGLDCRIILKTVKDMFSGKGAM